MRTRHAKRRFFERRGALENAAARSLAAAAAGSEGLHDEKELRRVGEAFKGTPLATTILERGGKTPWRAPAELHEMGYSMLLYPTTLIFRATWAIQSAPRPQGRQAGRCRRQRQHGRVRRDRWPATLGRDRAAVSK
jgi:2-methylisocitrate lyase-like PEP mutase family enzyme